MLVEIKTKTYSQWTDIKNILYFNSYIKTIGFTQKSNLAPISYIQNYEELLITWKDWNNKKLK